MLAPVTYTGTISNRKIIQLKRTKSPKNYNRKWLLFKELSMWPRIIYTNHCNIKTPQLSTKTLHRTHRLQYKDTPTNKVSTNSLRMIQAKQTQNRKDYSESHSKISPSKWWLCEDLPSLLEPKHPSYYTTRPKY